jgi:hypothetical protein
MTLLEVGRIHARYRDCAMDSAARFDAALDELARTQLELAMVGRVESQAEAVCMRRLEVAVRLDDTATTAELARAWADAIVVALARRLDQLDEVVVYRRVGDALIDLVRSLAAGQRTRLWAWQQVGLVDQRTAWPAAPHVAAALTRNPHLVPLVLNSTRDLEMPLDSSGWLTVAAALESIVRGTSGSVGAARSTSPSADDFNDAPWLVRQLPWQAASDAERRQLAVLVLACTEPWAARDGAATQAVVAAASASTRTSAALAGTARDTTDAGNVSDRATTRTSSAIENEPVPPTDRPVPPLAVPSHDLSATEAEVVSDVGGVLFLVHAITALRLVERLLAGELPTASLTVSELIVRLAARVAGAAPNDPAVIALAGLRPDDSVDVGRDLGDGAHLEPVFAEVLAWVQARLPGSSCDADLAIDELRWIWRRRATIVAERGWIEATFSLDDVDVRLRLAGLDLDPGFVWWLGAVVRYRYE